MTRAEVLKNLADAIERRGGETARQIDVAYLRKLSKEPRFKRVFTGNEFWDDVVSTIISGAWTAGRKSEREWLMKTGQVKR